MNKNVIFRPATTGFGATTFGTPATTTNTGGLTFSTPATSTATATGALNFTFGGTPITSAPAQPVGLAAVTSTPAPAAAPTSAPLSLFQPAASSAISAPAGGLTFGTTPAATTSTTSTGLSFGLTSAAPTTSLPLNLATSSLSFGAATSAATSTTCNCYFFVIFKDVICCYMRFNLILEVQRGQSYSFLKLKSS